MTNGMSRPTKTREALYEARRHDSTSNELLPDQRDCGINSLMQVAMIQHKNISNFTTVLCQSKPSSLAFSPIASPHIREQKLSHTSGG